MAAPPPHRGDRSAGKSAGRKYRRRSRLVILTAGLLPLAGAMLAVVLSRHVRHPAHIRPAVSARAPAPPLRRRGSQHLQTGRLAIEPVPILMYHVIARPRPGAPYPGLYVPPREFAAQMDALARAGYHAVTLDQVEASRRQGIRLPPGNPIVLSFDNGYRTQYTQALPVLRHLGWVGVENLQLSGLPPSQGGLGPRQVRALVAAGWELDTQGLSHADLVRLGPSALRHQVAVARAEIQHRYRVPVDWFCYPSGDYDPSVIAAVRAAGYLGATTVVPGWARPGDDPYRLPRLRVLGGTSPSALLEQIAETRRDPAPPTRYGS